MKKNCMCFCISKPMTKHEAFKIKRVNTMIGQKISQKNLCIIMKREDINVTFN